MKRASAVKIAVEIMEAHRRKHYAAGKSFYEMGIEDQKRYADEYDRISEAITILNGFTPAEAELLEADTVGE